MARFEKIQKGKKGNIQKMSESIEDLKMLADRIMCNVIKSAFFEEEPAYTKEQIEWSKQFIRSMYETNNCEDDI